MKERLLRVIKNYLKIMSLMDKNCEVKCGCWVEEVENEKIVSKKLRDMIESMFYYWGPKDREYANYLDNLIGGVYND